MRNYGHVLVLLALVAAELVALATAVLCVLLTFGLGMVFVFPPQTTLTRRVTGAARRLAEASAGVRIDPPYLPKPPPPRPQADGMYRSDRTLYKSPRVPAWNDRWKWLVSDPATWRDTLWLLLDPLIKTALLPLLLLSPARGLRVHAQWSTLLLAPTASSRLARRLESVTHARHLAVDTQAAEMRRIERDLHDGAQARLVALGMTLGAAEQLMDKDPDAAKALMAKAREASADTLTELRRVIHGIHPPVLAERGLGDAVRVLALDSALQTSVEVDLTHRPEAPVEAAAYFAISELLSNAARHSGAASVHVTISGHGPNLLVTVSDDGKGGADPSRGTGLRGIERRLAAFDGTVAFESPPGGPTTVVLELPKVLPQHWSGLPAELPRWKTALVIGLWTTFWCPLFPQGIVAGSLKAFGVDERSWFLARYLPEPWQWPCIAFMIVLGTAMAALAAAIPATHRREPPVPPFGKAA
ncbi:sensor histidine kinase [Actinocorallia sp. A-T 12471]|uniref:sensor histidine kinase n=1 Tax=Actinocorallia sp. A-T 12471 TaxID=3089813 RepID=UPI0029D034F8|nr:sensor histidine kinase [Actinocorallia sp. A-T 12471]MDX6738708.1 sensor histidine kinase [Actinocorallia sp. A-T 12471]